MDLVVIGINFRTAPVALREKVSFASKAASAVLAQLRAAFPSYEFVLLSTCNRTELYAAGPDIEAQTESLFRELLEGVGPSHDDIREHSYVQTRIQAARHLFAVASGLDSMVVGEAEILGQVKQAYGLAIEAESSGERLHPLFQNAFRVAKQVRTQTDLCRGRVSVSSIAVEFVEKVFDELGTKTVMIVGAGETAELVLRCLLEKGAGEVLVLNRSQPKCQSLAEKYGGHALAFDRLGEHLPRADIVMSSTSAPHCMLHTALVRKAMRSRQGRPMLLMDLAVPRDIEAGACELENVYLYDIDDLQKIAAENLARRQSEVEKARRIVREGAAELASLFESADLGTLMKELDEKATLAGSAELECLTAKPLFASLSGEQREEIGAMLGRAVSRVLGEPRKALRRASQDGRWDDYVAVAKDLFDLDEPSPDKEQEPGQHYEREDNSH
jgi:glutamyl-tRNA reductase